MIISIVVEKQDNIFNTTDTGLLRAKMMISVLCLLIMHCQGFLLDTGTGQISSSGQFLSESEFLAAKSYIIRKLMNHDEIRTKYRLFDNSVAK